MIAAGRYRLGVAVVLLFFSCNALASDSANLRRFPATGTLQLVLHDDINLPFYSWPQTLISYPVDFSEVHAKPNQLQLVNDATGKPVSMQLTNVQETPTGELKSADVCFFSDLKPGATESFGLVISTQPIGPAVARIKESVGSGVTEIDGGSLQIRIPQTQRITASHSVPAPIISLNRGMGWIGDNHLISPNKRVTSLTTACLASGPLFRTYQIRYDFDGGGIYIATVKIVAGYTFVNFAEEMRNLSLGDGAQLDMSWSSFKASLRYPAGDFDVLKNQKWLGIDEAVITPDIEEDPKWIPPSEIEDPSKDMAFELAGYSGNGVRDATPVASFWENHPDGSELSVFTLDTLKWQDHQYGIWQPTPLLQVHFRHDAGDGLLHWTWPLITGSRSTGIALDDAARAQAIAEAFVKTYLSESEKYGGSSQVQDMRDVKLRSGQLLRAWYGSLSLDHVKDMVLTYPDAAKQAAPLVDSGEIKSVEQFNDRLQHSALALYPLGTNLVAMDIRHRELYDALIPAYDHLHNQLADEDKKRAVAMMLLSAYMNSTDDMAAVRICLGGTPNMCADGFSVPAEITYLFPDHPMAAQWREQFEKTLRLMACYYTRPDVLAWDSLGGRWTESLSVYNWAYLRPTELAEFCAESGDHQNRFANPWTAMRGRWMVDELTAPIYNPMPYWRQPKDPKLPTVPRQSPPSPDWKTGMRLSGDFGFDRQYPAHGAHGSGTAILVPWQARYLGHLLQHYDPMVAEHLLWAANQARTKDNGEMSPDNLWAREILGSIGDNSGTPPHLISSKYTGHGIIFRAGVGTPEELSIHLDQVDRGPNYRWGDNGQGACGVLYFYAQGKIWSGHERENTGDHYNEDTVGTTNFGFMKDGKYRDIGPNTLERPLYDLSVAQFTELKSLRGPGAYSWPQYDSRSILLVGTDYLVIHDRTGAQPAPGSGRFSWFQARDLPFPKLIFLQPLAARADHLSEVQTQSSHGIMRDADGSSVVLVTHKGDAVEMQDMTATPISFIQSADLRSYAWNKGVKQIAGVWPILAPHSHDLLFVNDQSISCKLPTGDSFQGSAGVIRHPDNGTTEMAIFQGSRIGTKELTLVVPDAEETGISAVYQQPGEVSGQYYSPHGPTKLTLAFADVPPTDRTFVYIDGEKQSASITGLSLEISLPAGHHHWQLTAHLPRPMPVNVTRTENFADGASVCFDPVAGADSYQLQSSSDGGTTWADAGKSPASPIKLSGLTSESKIHVRLIASNAEQSSEPGDAFPIYVTAQPPAPPDGLYLHLSSNRVEASWGQVLGVSEYRLYRRQRSEADSAWKLIYKGLDRSYSDAGAKGVVPPNALPGPEYASVAPSTIYEYTIAAANGNGEGIKSPTVNTDPSDWRVWWPPGQLEEFKRPSAYWSQPYVPVEQVPPLRYPTSSDHLQSAAGRAAELLAATGLNDPIKKEIAMQLVSSAENSSLDWKAQYAYIEYNVEGNAKENRGYTGGIIGFTSRTHDMLELVEHYDTIAPGNVLEKYLPTLRAVDGTSSRKGPGKPFELDWKAAAKDQKFREAQDHERDQTCFNPAVEQAKKDGLHALGQFIYYDAIVMHGGGDYPSSFGGIRSSAMKKAKTPAQGGDETVYLNAFLDARKAAMLTEQGHSDTSRVDTMQRAFIRDGNLDLNLPLEFKVYGDPYKIPDVQPK